MSDPILNEPACLKFEAMLGLVDDELSADDQAALSAHLDSCAACRAQAESLWRQDRALVELAAASGLADELASRIGRRLREAGTGELAATVAEVRPAVAVRASPLWPVVESAVRNYGRQGHE